MPGLVIPVKYLEVLNEPDINADYLDFYNGTADDYAELLIKTSKAIRSADPEAKILIAGSAEGNDNFLNFYRKVFENPATHNAFDIGNVHCISNDDYGSYNIKSYKKMLAEFDINKPIWVTEAEALVSNDSDTNANQTYISTKKALGLGAEKIVFSHQKFDRDPGKTFFPKIPVDPSLFEKDLDCNDPLSAFEAITNL